MSVSLSWWEVISIDGGEQYEKGPVRMEEEEEEEED